MIRLVLEIPLLSRRDLKSREKCMRLFVAPLTWLKFSRFPLVTCFPVLCLAQISMNFNWRRNINMIASFSTSASGSVYQYMSRPFPA